MTDREQQQHVVFNADTDHAQNKQKWSAKVSGAMPTMFDIS